MVTPLNSFTKQFQVNSTVTGWQDDPAIATLNNGEFVVTWRSEGQIYGQRYDGNGNSLGTEFLVSSTIGGESASVSGLSNGGFIVTWDGGSDIYGQRFDSQGLKVGSTFFVNQTSLEHSYYNPWVVGLNNGNFAVVWGSSSTFYHADGSVYNGWTKAEFSVFSSSGAILNYGPMPTLNYWVDNNEPTLTALTNGGFVAVWRTVPGSGAFALVFDNDGNGITNTFQVTPEGGFSYNSVAINTLNNNNFIVSWGDDFLDNIYGQIYNNSGVKVGLPFQIDTLAGDQLNQQITALPTGGFLATWTARNDTTNSNVQAGIYGQYFSDLGAKVGQNFLITPVPESFYPYTLAITALDNGNIIITWSNPDNTNPQDQEIMAGIITLPHITVTATDATAAETLTGAIANPGVFTLTRTGNINQALTVSYTLSGTATKGKDYSNLTGTVTFAANSNTAKVTITPIDDLFYEGNETVIFSLKGNVNYLLGTTTTATINLVENDPKPTITVSATDATAAETLTGTTANSGLFTLTRTGDTTQSLIVNYTLTGTAVKGSDYNNLTGIATFLANSSTATVTINPLDDSLYEGNETVILTLASGTNYLLGTTKTSTINLLDNDKPTITVSASDGTAAETLSTQTPNPGVFQLTRTGNTSQALTVNYLLTGTATKGSDYQNLTGAVTFAANSSTTTVSINPLDDTLYEGNETVILTLTSGTNYLLGTAKTATVNLVENDPKPTITVLATDATAAETLATQTPDLGVFTLTRTGNVSQSQIVNYSLTGTATKGTDYKSMTGTATFAANSATTTVTVTPINDTLYEGNETVILTLTSGTNYLVGTAKTATVTLLEDDPKPTITISATDANAGETLATETPNPGLLTLSRTGNITQALTVNYSLTGTATQGTDYSNLTRTVTFAANSRTATISLSPLDDAVYEGHETVIVNLTAGTNYLLGTAKTATVNLLDNELKPTISVTATDAIAAETLSSQARNSGTFTLTRTGNLLAPLTVTYTLSGTAKNGIDYSNLAGTVTFTAGSNTAAIAINPIDDNLIEIEETLGLTLVSSNLYNLGNSNATINLRDNDFSLGNEFRVNTNIPKIQTSSAVTALTNRNCIVTWAASDPFDNINGAVYAQLYDSNLLKIGGEFLINTYAYSDYSYTSAWGQKPTITPLENGNFVVTWSYYQGMADISGQRYDSLGNKLGSVFRVNTTTTDVQDEAASVVLSNGNFVVTWSSQAQDGSSGGIYGQRFDSNGAKLGSEFRVNTTTLNHQSDSAIAALANGNFVVTWSSQAQDGNGAGIYGQRFDSNGIKVGSEFRVNTFTTNDQIDSTITTLLNGDFVVAWSSKHQDGDDFGIYGQRFNNNGVKVGSEFLVNTYTDNEQANAAITALKDGGFLITWSSNYQDGYQGGVYGQRFDRDSNRVGAEFRVNNYTSETQTRPAVTTLNNGNTLISWEGHGVIGTVNDDEGIFARKMTIGDGIVGTMNTSTSDSLLASNQALAAPSDTASLNFSALETDYFASSSSRYDSTNNLDSLLVSTSPFAVNTDTTF